VTSEANVADSFNELTSIPLTPGLALLEILRRTGYVKSKAEFARLLRMNEGNVYHHLAEPEQHYRIAIPLGALHALCWTIDRVTGLRIEIRLTPDSELELRVFGTDVHGNDIDPPIRARTLYATPFVGAKANEPYVCDFQPTRPWRREWEEDWDLQPIEEEGPPEEDGPPAVGETSNLQE
jgi:hypothetical protein